MIRRIILASVAAVTLVIAPIAAASGTMTYTGGPYPTPTAEVTEEPTPEPEGITPLEPTLITPPCGVQQIVLPEQPGLEYTIIWDRDQSGEGLSTTLGHVMVEVTSSDYVLQNVGQSWSDVTATYALWRFSLSSSPCLEEAIPSSPAIKSPSCAQQELVVPPDSYGLTYRVIWDRDSSTSGVVEVVASRGFILTEVGQEWSDVTDTRAEWRFSLGFTPCPTQSPTNSPEPTWTPTVSPSESPTPQPTTTPLPPSPTPSEPPVQRPTPEPTSPPTNEPTSTPTSPTPDEDHPTDEPDLPPTPKPSPPVESLPQTGPSSTSTIGITAGLITAAGVGLSLFSALRRRHLG